MLFVVLCKNGDDNLMDTFKRGLKLCVNMIIAAIISFFLCFSMLNIFQALFTVETGYTAYVYETSSSTEPCDTYNYQYVDKDGDGKYDGIDEKEIEYREKGFIVEKIKERTHLTGLGKVIFRISTQILSFIMVISFAASDTYKQGLKESNLIRLGKKKYDVTKGFKIGLIGNVPFFLIFIVAIVMTLGIAPKVTTLLYATVNSHYYSTILWITGSKVLLSEVSIWRWILLLLLQFIAPVISGIAYILGVKEINLMDKIMYKKEVK